MKILQKVRIFMRKDFFKSLFTRRRGGRIPLRKTRNEWRRRAFDGTYDRSRNEK